MDLILAKIKALLRRNDAGMLQDTNSHSKRGSTAQVDLDALVLDEESRFASLNGLPLKLTTFEFDLLALLATRVGKAVSRQELYQLLKKTAWNGLDRSIDYHILNLRKKLGDDGKNPKRIKSIRGVGYLLVKNPRDF